MGHIVCLVLVRSHVRYASLTKVGIAFRTLCSKRAFDAMRYAKHIIAAFCGILRRYLDVSRSITVVWVLRTIRLFRSKSANFEILSQDLEIGQVENDTGLPGWNSCTCMRTNVVIMGRTGPSCFEVHSSLANALGG